MNSRRMFLAQTGVPFVALAQQTTTQPAERQPQVPFRPRPTEWKADWYQVDWEAEMQQTGIVKDTIFVHHTADPSGVSLEELSKRQYRLYEDRYLGKTSGDADPYIKGEKPYSGHWRIIKGKSVQVWWAYHWLIREDGKTERLLHDEEVGWHAGPPKGWMWNMRSIALCFDGNYSISPPPMPAQEACARLIGEYAKQFPVTNLKGHADVRNTECPGPWFGTKGEDGLTGRERLIKLSGIVLPA